MGHIEEHGHVEHATALVWGFSSAWLLVLASAACQDQQPASELDSFAIGDRQHALRLTRDRVGVALDEGVTFEQLAPLLPPGLALSPETFDELIVLDPTGPTDRDALVKLARDLQRRAPGLIDHAGVLVTPEGASQPMLLTHELVVRFKRDTTDAQIDAFIVRYGLQRIRTSAFQPRLLLLAAPVDTGLDALEAARLVQRDPLVLYAEPNLAHDVQRLSTHPDDPYYPLQWHHANTGQGGGTVDADIDTPLAWDITTGSDDVIIAVLENGFDAQHPDLLPNLWTHPDEAGAPGWDYEDDDGSVEGNPDDSSSSAHGTSVAGCAGARGDNGIGVSGSCPRCKLMLIKLADPTTYFQDSEAIRFAWNHGADIISNSWTYLDNHPVPLVVQEAINEAATDGRGGKGCLVLFAVRNEELNVDDMQDLAALKKVLAVSAVTNWDERTMTSGFGSCVSVLGPTRLSKTPGFTEGSLNVTTTDWRGAPGYNDTLIVTPTTGGTACDDIAGDHDYTACFGGTSAATPIVAGVAGLLLSVDPELTRDELRHLLQDTTDHVQDSMAAYAESNGYSTALTHGFGRINAFEAVRVAAPVERGGRGGVDVFLRDNRLDWGNTEQPSHVRFERQRGVIGHWQSVDIKVDAPPFATPAPLAPASFAAFTHEAPRPGVENRVYVRVRNRGTEVAEPVSVELHWAWAGTTAPPLPAGFWSATQEATDGAQPSGVPAADWPSDVSTWHAAGRVDLDPLPPSGASLAGGEDDAARVANFAFTAPSVSPGPGPRHLSLLAVLRSPADPPAPGSLHTQVVDLIVPRDNNVTYRNVALAAPPATTISWVLVRNPTHAAIDTQLQLAGPYEARLRLAVLGTNVPAGLAAPPVLIAGDDATAFSPVFPLPAGATLLLRLTRPAGGEPGPLELRQWDQPASSRRLLGGLQLDLAAPST